jgi:hypothetical protein
LRDGLSDEACAEIFYDAATRYGFGYADKFDKGDEMPRQAYALANAAMAAGMAVLLDATWRDKVIHRDWLQHDKATSAGEAAAAQPVVVRAQQLIAELTRSNEAGEFWDYTNTLELRLACNVLSLAVDGTVNDGELESLHSLVDRALVRWPSPVELQSMKSTFATLLAVLERHAERKAKHQPADSAAGRLMDVASEIQQKLDRHRVGGGA